MPTTYYFRFAQNSLQDDESSAPVLTFHNKEEAERTRQELLIQGVRVWPLRTREAYKWEKARWVATVSYIDRSHETEAYHIEELGELEQIVEHGPDWRLIEVITLSLNKGAMANASRSHEDKEKGK